jgi:hypothetical protein
MSYILDTAEDLLKLTAAEKATVNAALPTVAVWVKMLNLQWGTLQDAVNWLTASKAVASQLITDGKALGPVAEDVLTDNASIFEVGGAYGAFNDAKSVIAANPKLIAALTADYQKLAPLIAQIESDFKKPEVQAAWDVLQAKMGQHNISMPMLAAEVLKRART